jgi:hypothetical protein
MADDPQHKHGSVDVMRQMTAERVFKTVNEPRVLAARIRAQSRGRNHSDSTASIAADRGR